MVMSKRRMIAGGHDGGAAALAADAVARSRRTVERGATGPSGRMACGLTPGTHRPVRLRDGRVSRRSAGTGTITGETR